MTLAVTYSRALAGIDAPLVTVETHLGNGLPGFNIVGLPEAAVRESRDRVRSALINTNFEFPIKKITVNLAPADLPKDGGRFDLPIALGILAASQQLKVENLQDYECAGELALSGGLRPIHGVLPLALRTRAEGKQLIIPLENAKEAALISGMNIFAAGHLLDVVAHLSGERQLATVQHDMQLSSQQCVSDVAEVKGQLHAKRALLVAAAGRHNLLFVGAPGTGKTMLATRLPSILPTLSAEQSLDNASVQSLTTQGFDVKTWGHVPFRSPHHSTSTAALVGGGRPPKPGEISLAHNGILFLDELPEYGRSVLEALREPLESGWITISRAQHQMRFPARFQFIAAMNPCPCGYAGVNPPQCQCSDQHIKRYLGKISGPLWERIDMHVEVPRLSPEELLNYDAHPAHYTSAYFREQVAKAHTVQYQRQGKLNSELLAFELEKIAILNENTKQTFSRLLSKFQFSGRTYHRILKLMLTLMDLEGKTQLEVQHLSEALSFRMMDRRMKSG